MEGALGSEARPQSALRGRRAGSLGGGRSGVVRALGGLQITEMMHPGIAGHPRDGMAGAAGEDRRLLILNLDGPGTIISGNAAFPLGAGDLLLVDGHLPLRREGRGGCREIRVHLPCVPMHERHALPQPAVPCLIDGRDAIGMVLRELICALLDAEGPFCTREEAGVRDAVLDLVAAACCARRHHCPGGHREPWTQFRGATDPSRQWRMLVDSVEAQLSDPALSPATVAATRGISTRHLHRLFRQAGVSFSTFVRTRRLERCRADLADPRSGGVPLTEIAYRWGFSDSSHFSRCFRAAFGCTASEFRARQVQTRSQGGLALDMPGSGEREATRTALARGGRP